MKTYHYNLGLAFAEITKKYSAKTALSYSEKNYLYSDLSQWAENLGSLLLSHGLKRGDVIAIGNTKSPLSYALIIAALRLGIVYVNLDVASPLSRNAHILNICNASILFYDNLSDEPAMEKLAAEQQCPAIYLNLRSLPTVSKNDHDLQKSLLKEVDGSCIAYVMFTSGSTGTPKGVAVTHQNILHFISWGQQNFQINCQDNFANLSPMYFDNSVFDFYIGLFSGASLSPIPRELLSSPYELIAHVGKMECTIWFSVPSLLIYLMAMKAITSASLPTIRYIIFGGEGYPKAELKKLYELFFKQTRLVNVYGPTECTCICSAYTLSESDFTQINGLPPLGKINPNFDYLILDEYDKETNEGELCLIGPNVAAGYFNDMERTTSSFITLTDSCHFMKRMYRTGDLVKITDGNLHFVGRKDNQIKHMGYRIELEEIEHALVKFPQINQAAVVYHRTNTAYGKLLAFIASAEALSEPALLSELAEVLPGYMIPSRIIMKKELPKSPNGKVDRQQLLAYCQE